MFPSVFFPQPSRKIYSLSIYGPLSSFRQGMEPLFNLEEMKIVETFEKSRIQRDNLIKNTIKEGLNRLESHDIDDAGTYFDKVIAMLSADGLTVQERNLLAQAHTYKAKTLRIGSEASEDSALVHLELALAILPDFKEAISIKDSILIDRTPPEMSLPKP